MENKDLLQRYLLGGLSATEQERIEREYSANDALKEALQIAETDLIDAYVFQELSEDQRRQFESYFLDSSERRMRVEIARMLMSSEVRERVPVGPIVKEKLEPAWWKSFFSFRVGFATAALVAVAAIVFLLAQNQRLRNELDRSRSAGLQLQDQMEKLRQQPAQDHVDAQARVEPPPVPPGLIASLMLSPGLLRGGGSQQSHVLTLPRTASTALLMLALDPASEASSTTGTNYSHYDVVLETIEGRKLRTLKGLTSQRAPDGGRMVPARFPSQLLEEGDYFVTLLGRTAGNEGTELASYSFSVTR
jgi:hypothetical protein